MPSALLAQFDTTLQFKSGSFLDFGVMGGYAHTFVVSSNGSSPAPWRWASVPRSTANSWTHRACRGLGRPPQRGFHAQGRVAFGRDPAPCLALSYNIERTYSLGGRTGAWATSG